MTTLSARELDLRDLAKRWRDAALESDATLLGDLTAETTALLEELDPDRLRCQWCGDALALDEIVGHLASEGRVIPALAPVKP